MKLGPIPNYGDLIPIDEWIRDAKNGCYTPYDGDGYWAAEDGMNRNSDLWEFDPPKWATHVMWFNR